MLVLTNGSITGGWGNTDTISFQITNGTVANPNPTGLQAQLSGNANLVPEPGTLVLLCAGLVSLGLLRRRRA